MSEQGDLAARVERLEAAEGVRELLLRYVRVIDSKPTAAALADLFTEDVVVRSSDGNERTGRDAVVAYYEGIVGAPGFSRHHIMGSAIEVESPRRATHRSRFVALRGDGAGTSTVIFGDYEDVAVRGDDGRWRFARKDNGAALITTLEQGWG